MLNIKFFVRWLRLVWSRRAQDIFSEYAFVTGRISELEEDTEGRLNLLNCLRETDNYKNNNLVRGDVNSAMSCCSMLFMSQLRPLEQFKRRLEQLSCQKMNSLFPYILSVSRALPSVGCGGKYIFSNDLGVDIKTTEKSGCGVKGEKCTCGKDFRTGVACDWLAKVGIACSLTPLLEDPFIVEKKRYICCSDRERWVVLNLVAGGSEG